LKSTGSDVIYHPLPNVAEKKYIGCTQFGYGKRSDFTQGAKGKCGQFYDIKSFVEDKNAGSPKFTMGISRQFYEKVYNEADSYHDKSFPGPGEYKVLKNFGHEAKKFTMAGKLEPKNLSKANVVPGPEKYDTRNKPGQKQYSSKNKNVTNIIWSVDKSPRFNYVDKNKFPGPQKYEVKPLIDEKGKGQIFISKFKSSPGKTMGSRYYENPAKK